MTAEDATAQAFSDFKLIDGKSIRASVDSGVSPMALGTYCAHDVALGREHQSNATNWAEVGRRLHAWATIANTREET